MCFPTSSDTGTWSMSQNQEVNPKGGQIKQKHSSHDQVASAPCEYPSKKIHQLESFKFLTHSILYPNDQPNLNLIWEFKKSSSRPFLLSEMVWLEGNSPPLGSGWVQTTYSLVNQPTRHAWWNWTHPAYCTPPRQPKPVTQIWASLHSGSWVWVTD